MKPDVPCFLRCHFGRIEKRDALDVAWDVMGAIAELRSPVALYVHADRQVEIVRAPTDALQAVDHAPTALVGIYSWGAKVADIRDDILAMPMGESA